METNTEIPNLKLAKVGDKRRRRDKGGGLIGLGGAGGAGGAGTFAAVGVKIGVAILVAALGAGAYNVGVSLRPDESQFAAKNKPKTFAATAKPKYEGNVSNLPSTPKPSGDSLSMVSGSLGENPEQQAAQTAQSAQDAQKKDPAETPPPDAAAVPAEMNPADMMAAAAKAAGAPGAEPEKDKKKTFASRFGSLSSQLGGGQSSLAGGAGLAGGIGRGFEMPKFENTTGRASGFRSAARAPSQTARVSHAGGRKGALGQLKKTNQLSINARHLAGEAGAEQAKLAFDHKSGLQTPLSGVGTGAGRSPTDHTMDTSANPSAGGGPTEGQQYQPSGGGGGGGGGGDSGGKNKTKWQKWVNMASNMLLLATGLLLAATFCAWMARRAAASGAGTATVYHWVMAAKILGWMAAGAAAIVALMGLAIIGMGQRIQGSIFTAIGLLMTWAGYAVATAPEVSNTASGQVSAYIVKTSTVTNSLLGWSTLAGASGGAMGGLGSSGASHHWDA